MDFQEHLNIFIEEMVEELITPGQARILLLSEDFAFHSPDGPFLLTEMHKKYRQLSGGRKALIARTGRINPRLSRIARQTAIKHRSSRMQAQRKSTTKLKRRRTQQDRKRMGIKTRGVNPQTMNRKPKVRRPPKRHMSVTSRMTRPSGRRGYHGAKRHAAPRVRRR
jgi:hypothetical protein